MAFNFGTDISALTVFLQGILSFLSPCVLPLLPVYLGFFAGSNSTNSNGEVTYPRGKTFINTLSFILGISTTFYLLGFVFTSLGSILTKHKNILAIISALLMLFFGLYQLGVFKRILGIERERRLPLDINKISSSPVSAFILGFTFSFAWTPCLGPSMTSVLSMAASSQSSATGFFLITVYILGFIIPFLITGIFTAEVLNFFRTRMSLLKYTAKLGGVLLIFMGILTFTSVAKTGLSNNKTANESTKETVTENITKETTEVAKNESKAENAESTSAAESKERNQTATTHKDADTSKTETQAQPQVFPATDFVLKDQNGNIHKLSDYKGKVVFLNFWATWCPPCRAEMPDIQALYEKYGENKGDVIVLGIAAPNMGNEKDIEGISKFLSDNGYTYPVVMDDTAQSFFEYGIQAFPTTFMINTDGNIFGYASGAINPEMMEDMISRTKENRRD